MTQAARPEQLARPESAAVETAVRTEQADFFSIAAEVETRQPDFFNVPGQSTHPDQSFNKVPTKKMSPERKLSENITLKESIEAAPAQVSPKIKRAGSRDDARRTIKRFEQVLETTESETEKQPITPIHSASFNKKTILILACCVALIAVGFLFGLQASQLASSVHIPTAALPNLFSDIESQSAPDIRGWYEISCSDSPVEIEHWQLVLDQKGRHIFAQSMNNGKSWKLDGQILLPDRLRFEKTFLDHGKPTGFPIVYNGRYEVRGVGTAVMGGAFAGKNKVFKLRPQVMEVKGNWRSKYLASIAIVKDGAPPPPSTEGTVETDGGTGKKPNILELLFSRDKHLNSSQLSNLFSQIAFGLVGIGVLIALGALYIFSPYGKLNRMAKQEYIPSQYRTQHNKMMREWSKPIKRGSVPLGTRAEWRFWKPWVPRVMAMPPESRAKNPHMILIGGSDTGKSRAMANMICHDIESNDRAVVVIDSDGGLIDLIKNWTACHARGQALAKRIVVVDPTYRKGSMSYNPLEPLENVNFIDAASAIVHGFKAIYTEPPGSQSQWNQQTANILRNAAILLMANERTLVDLPTLLQDNDFRDILLEAVEKKKHERTEYMTLIETWGQYKKLARTDQWITWVEPILNRITPMLSDPRIRPILTKPVGDLRLHDLIVNKQVLLVRIPQGQLDQNANLLGSLIVTGLKQAALSLSNYESDKQQPCALYLDELNNFIEKETIEALTQESDKFQIGFVGCCKTLQHLPEDFRNQIIINVGTLLTFALAKKDGDMIGPQMFRVDGRKIKHRTIQNFFNQVNTSPQFELISDEEKLNIDRVVGQEERHFFCYRVGSVAGTFNLKSLDFADPPKAKINSKLIEQMHKP
jgi:hypothetical protein